MNNKIKDVQAKKAELAQELVSKAQARDAARDAFSNSNVDLTDTNSSEYKAVEKAVKEHGEIADQIASLEQVEKTLLAAQGNTTVVTKAAQPESNDENPFANVIDAEKAEVLKSFANSTSNIGRVSLKSIPREVMKAVISGTTASRRGAFGGFMPVAPRRLSVLDLLPVEAMSENTFPYTQETGSFAAAEQTEGSAKAEAGITLTDAEASAATIAHYKIINKQALADAPALNGLIEQHLRVGVLRRLEGQIIAGDGSTPNMRGIVNTSGVGSVSFDADKPLADLILSGIVDVDVADGQANGIVVNPVDWEKILSTKANFEAETGVVGGSGEYLAGGPFATVANTLWGVPLVKSNAVTAGTALVGDFALGAMLMVRDDVHVLVSDSHASTFIQNQVTVLAEGRYALPVFYPGFFSVVDLAA